MASLSRRQLLISGGAAIGAALAPRIGQTDGMEPVVIERIETFPVVYPTSGRFKFFEDHLGRPTGRQTVVVKVTAKGGQVGWGQSVPTHKWSYETLESVHTTIDRYLTPVLVGMDARDTAAVHKMMNSVIAPSFSTGQPICKAGIDLALFDLIGRADGRSASQMWGRNDTRTITLSWTLNPKTIPEIEELVRQGWEKGFRNFNVKVAPDLKFDVEMCKAVKKLAPDGFLWADANGGYDEATALEAAPKLADAGVAVLEQPLPSNRLTATKKVRDLKALPILLDEPVVSPSDLEEFIRLGVLDGVAMKPARCGGLTSARAQVEILEREKMMFLGSGLTDPDLSLAASLLLYGAYGLKYPAALNGPQFLSAVSILKQPLVPVGGKLRVPDGPGLGVEVDETKVRRLAQV